MKIKYMDSFLYWYSQNNKIIIQLLCVSIGLVLIYFIYRMFFAPAETASDGGSPITSKQIAELDKKISKIIDHQTASSQPAVFTGEASEYEANAKAEAQAESALTETAVAGAKAESQSAIEQIQNEVAQLKSELQVSNEMITAKNAELNTVKEKLIEYQKSIPGSISSVQTTSDNLTTNSNILVTGTGGASGDPDLIAKVDELERKLREYDIISDDIAELQSLRAENAELKAKASAG